MNKSSIFGFILIAAILFGWMMWMAPSKEELAEQQRVQDSIREARHAAFVLDSIRQAEKRVADSVFDAQTLMNEAEGQDSLAVALAQQQMLEDKYGAFANASAGEEQTWTVETKLQRLVFSSKGGFLKEVELKDYKTYDSLPLIVFDPDNSVFDISFFAQNRVINTSNFFFKPYLNGQPYSGEEMKTVEGDSLVFALRMNGGADQYIEYVYTIKDDNYMVGFDVNFVGMDEVLASNSNVMTIDWKVDLLKQEKSTDRFSGESVYFRSLKDKDVDHLDEFKDDEETIQTKLKWVSFKQRFFCNVLVADNEFENARMTVHTTPSGNPRYFKSMSANIEAPVVNGASGASMPMSLYFGPNHFKTLKSYGLGMQNQINLGRFFLIRWINYGVIAVFNWLSSYGWNYGIVILILTIMIKALLFPIAFKSYKSTAITRVLKPEMEAINAKYPKEEDAMKKQQAVMNLQRQAGVSPASGCVPMLLQMPILFAVFRFFPASIELRQQPFLWAKDLSTYDSILDLPFNIPFYGDHVSLFCLFMTITTFIYTYVSNKQMDTSSNPSMRGMKIMTYLMPIMFLGLFNSYSAGLSYYYMLVNIITFIQMFVFRKMINEDKVRATIEKNKKKPVKKSNWQKRLEEAQKQQAKLQQQRR